MKLKILLTGRTGQIGSELEKSLPHLGQLVAVGRAQLDLARPETIRETLRLVRPDLIVNAAAYTDVDGAEKDFATASAVNANGPAVLAEEARKIGAALIHYSTDYVFDGRKTLPYEESDPPNPINAYGRSKLAGEEAIRAAAPPHVILRTSWIYGTRGTNFLLKFLRLASERKEIPVVDDQIGAPTWSRMVAVATTRIIAQVCSKSGGIEGFREHRAVYHLTAGGQANWYEFACAILEECSSVAFNRSWFDEVTCGRPLSGTVVRPVASSDFASPARRPLYSILSNAKILRDFDIQLPSWRVQLRAALRDDVVPEMGLSQ